MVGLEIEEKWATKTASRLQHYKNVEIVAGNAIENLPKDGTIFYLFNPFDEKITRQFLEKVKVLAQKRPITVVYCLTKNLSVFEEDQACKIQVIKTPPNYPSAIIQVGPLDKRDDAKSLAALESQRQFN
jgi:hypothetical protein